MIPQNIFREYDIRGTVGEELTGVVVAAIARGVATYLVGRGRKTAPLGRDNRPSSEPFAAILSDVFGGAGLDVVDLGLAPTSKRRNQLSMINTNYRARDMRK